MQQVAAGECTTSKDNYPGDPFSLIGGLVTVRQFRRQEFCYKQHFTLQAASCLYKQPANPVASVSTVREETVQFDWRLVNWREHTMKTFGVSSASLFLLLCWAGLDSCASADGTEISAETQQVRGRGTETATTYSGTSQAGPSFAWFSRLTVCWWRAMPGRPNAARSTQPDDNLLTRKFLVWTLDQLGANFLSCRSAVEFAVRSLVGRVVCLCCFYFLLGKVARKTIFSTREELDFGIAFSLSHARESLHFDFCLSLLHD